MDLSDQEFFLFREFIRRTAGISIRDNKKYLISQRLEPVVHGRGCQSFGGLYQMMKSDSSGELKDEIITAVTTNETSFFRDTHPFHTFKHHILPQLIDNGRRRNDRFEGSNKLIKIWSAGASTGQEPYSIAILIHEFLENAVRRNISPNNFAILATDISSKIIAGAEKGFYDESQIKRGLLDGYVRKYFQKEGMFWKVRDDIRSMVRFKQLNLTESFKLIGAFNVIFCRNVLIYFDDATKSRIVDQFYDILCDNGFLILGSTESLYGISEKFESGLLDQTIVYQKRRPLPDNA